MTHILVADDDPDIRELVRMQVQKLGHSCTTAADGKEALDALSSAEFALAILDIAMPEATGLEIAALIRSVDPHHELPIILISAYSRPGDIARGIRAGADAYITKPMDLGDLRWHISELLAGGAT